MDRIGIGPRGEITAGDNEGIWIPMSRIDWVDLACASAAEPPFFGSSGMEHRSEPSKSFTPPLCWPPLGHGEPARWPGLGRR
ncbi:MAG: hypothetical protein RL088_1928 [Verrucomicrobiota bacterium]|jgi:hypothetical protein